MKRPRVEPSAKKEQPSAPSPAPEQFGVGRRDGLSDAEYKALLAERHRELTALAEEAYQIALSRRRAGGTRGKPGRETVRLILAQLVAERGGKR